MTALTLIAAVLLVVETAVARPYAGSGVGFTEDSISPAFAFGYLFPNRAWRTEFGGEAMERNKNRSTPSAELGPTIAAERFDLKTRWFYAELSHALPKARAPERSPSGFELGLGAALMRVEKVTRIQPSGAFPEIYSNDAVWKAFPQLRIAFVKGILTNLEGAVEARSVLTAERHAGKGLGGWRFQLGLKWHPLRPGPER